MRGKKQLTNHMSKKLVKWTDIHKKGKVTGGNHYISLRKGGEVQRSKNSSSVWVWPKREGGEKIIEQ